MFFALHAHVRFITFREGWRPLWTRGTKKKKKKGIWTWNVEYYESL